MTNSGRSLLARTLSDFAHDSETTESDPRPPTLSPSTAPYIYLRTNEAARLKWQRGRDHYGETFVGHPLLELDEELLDAINYVAEAERQGWDLGDTDALLRALRKRVQREYRDVK